MVQGVRDDTRLSGTRVAKLAKNNLYPTFSPMTDAPIESDNTLIPEAVEAPEIPKPHIPLQKVSRFGNQPNKFGK